MLADLKFVQGAVAKKELVEGLTHFRIEGGFVKSYNGIMALCSPIALDIDCAPLAEPMIKAIANCDETVQLNLTANGKLAIRSGGFKVNIPCTDKETPHVDPEGEMFPVQGQAILDAIGALSPFMGVDASRPWSNGLLFRGGSAFATNNVIVGEYWVGNMFPKDCNIPRQAVREMLRIKEVPTHAQVCDKNITFHYESGRWIRAQLLDLSWPNISKILDKPCSPEPIDPSMFKAIETIKPFADANGRMYIENGTIRTHLDEIEGASHMINTMNVRGAYHMDMFKLLEGAVKSIDLSAWPDSCLWFGDKVRGAIIGIRVQL